MTQTEVIGKTMKEDKTFSSTKNITEFSNSKKCQNRSGHDIYQQTETHKLLAVHSITLTTVSQLLQGNLEMYTTMSCSW